MEEKTSVSGKKNPRKVIGIIFLMALLFGVIGVYLSGGSLKSLLLGLTSEEGEKVGVVKAVTGQLKRQPKDSLEFLEAQTNADLFNDDTVMTGPSDRSTIELFDGSVLELEPGSLIRLSFEKEAGVTGIQRRVLVDIVAGNVKGDMSRPKLVVRRGGKPVPKPTPFVTPTSESTPLPSALPLPPPSPSPSPSPEPSPSPSPSPIPSPSPSPTPVGIKPSEIRITQPGAGQVFVLPIGQTPPLKQALIFEAPTLPSVQVLMLLRNAQGKEVLRKTVKANKGRGGLLANFERPGNYQVELLNVNGKKIGRGIQNAFSVRGEYEGLEIEPPLVGGEAVDSNKYSGKRLKEFDVVLRWKPIAGVEKYHVLVADRAGKVLVDETTAGSTYAFPKGKIYTDPITYQIRAEFPNGYAANSKKENFLFNFNPPTPTLPVDGQSISVSDPEVIKQNGVLFSWQRTTFTESYEFEISADSEFSKILKRVPVKQADNFLVFRNLKPATYWWRVRAISGAMKSTPSSGFKMTVTP